MKRILTAFIWLTLWVNSVDVKAQAPPVELRVKPQLVIVDKRNPQVETSFLVEWEGRRIGDYCLNDDLSALPLLCWEQESSGDFAEKRVVVQSFSYWLKYPDREQPLVESKVELLTVGSSDRRRNRRNRHAWSIL